MQNPWRGLASYNDPANNKNEKYQFCGRNKATIEVLNLIQENLFTTLYGKSGIGKTSLLKAGVFPGLREKSFLPIALRLNNVDSHMAFSQFAVMQLEVELQNSYISVISSNDSCELQDWNDKDCLWRYFATHRFFRENEEIYPVLVFDQFEEILFRDNAKAINFLTQLYSLIDDNHIAETEAYHDDTNFRIVVSIREDDLYMLEDAIDYSNLGEFKFNRYRLVGMTYDEAKEVILLPGKDVIDKQDEDIIVNKIVSLATQNNNGGINTLILSLICSVVYDKASSAGGIITKGIVNTLDDNILAEFYTKAVSSLSSRQRQFIEKYMIDESGRRNSVPENLFNENIPDCPHLFEGANRIFYYTTDANGVDRRVELVHDLLAQSIYFLKNSKNKRKYGRLGKVIVVALLLVLSFVTFKYGFFRSGILYRIDIPGVTNEFIREFISCSMRDTLNCNHNAKISDCPFLKSVRFFGSNSNSNIFSFYPITLDNCPNLVNIHFEGNLTNIHLEIIDCPNLAPIILPQTLKDISIHSNELLEFEVIDNNRFIWDGKCLWKDKHDIVYLQPDVREMSGFVFHEEIQADSVSYEGRYFHNLRGKPLKDIVIFNEDSTEITGFKNWVDEIDLDLSEFSSVRSIDSKAFYGHDNIKSIVALPPDISNIGDSAFAENSSLRSVRLHSTKSIDLSDDVFANCPVLDTVVFSCNLGGRSQDAFYGCGNIHFDIEPEFCNNLELGVDNVVYQSGEARFFNMTQYGVCLENRKIMSYGDMSFSYALKINGYSENDRLDLIIKDGTQALWLPKALPLSSNLCINDLRALNGVKEIHIPFYSTNLFGGGLRPFEISVPEYLKHKITLYVPYGCKHNFDMMPSYMGFKQIKEDSLLQKVVDEVRFHINTVLDFMSHHSWLWILALLGIVLVGVFFFIVTFHGTRKDRKHRVLSAIWEALLMMSISVFTWIVVYWFLFEICFVGVSDIVKVIVCSVFATIATAAVLLLLFNNFFIVIKEKGIKGIYKEIVNFIKRRYKAVGVVFLLLCCGIIIVPEEKKLHEFWSGEIEQLKSDNSDDKVVTILNEMLSKTNRFIYPKYYKSISDVVESLRIDNCRVIAQCPLDSKAISRIDHLDASGNTVFVRTRDTSSATQYHSYIWDWNKNDITELSDFSTRSCKECSLDASNGLLALKYGEDVYVKNLESDVTLDTLSDCSDYILSGESLFFTQYKDPCLYKRNIYDKTTIQYDLGFRVHRLDPVENSTKCFMIEDEYLFDIERDTVSFLISGFRNSPYRLSSNKKYLLTKFSVSEIANDNNIAWFKPGSECMFQHKKDFISLDYYYQGNEGIFTLDSYKEKRRICNFSVPRHYEWMLDSSGSFMIVWDNKQLMILDIWDRAPSERYSSIQLTPEERKNYRLD